jgi:hypothetical protein
MLADVAAAFLLSRVIFYSVAVLSLFTIPEYVGPAYSPISTSAHPLIDASWRWDAGWYRHIAEVGYSRTGEGQESVAFFPLFPMLLRAVVFVAPDSALLPLGVALNHLIFLSALPLVWLYAEHHGGRAVAQRTLLLLCIYPTAVFFSAVYTEAFFLLLSAAALLAIQRQRFALAGVAGFLASLTRPTGILLTIPYVLQVWRARAAGLRQLASRAWPLGLIPAGLMLYMTYLWSRFGEPLAFLRVQEAWGKERVSPVTALLDSFVYLATTETRDMFYAMTGINTGLVVWALVMTAITFRSDSLGATFALSAVLVPLASGGEWAPTVSMGRYVLVLFPLLIPLARWAVNGWVHALLIAAFLPTNVILTALFVRWYWVV